MTSFWRNLERPFFILAPMEAVTDVVFRHVIAHAASPDVYFTEFTNATGWMHAGDKAIGGRLVKTDDEQPIVAQLWGSDPIAIEKLSVHCRKLGFHGIDINMGCPDASAIKSGGGAQMIRTPAIAAQIIDAAKQSGLPVSVKTRLGYSRVDELHDWIAFLLHQHIETLTIHLRTKKEMSNVAAHYEYISDISALRDSIASDTLLVINGDIQDRQQGMALVEKYTGIDGVMIGRGVFHNPYCFEKEPITHGKEQLINLLFLHIELYERHQPVTHRPFDTLKRFFKIYIRDFEGAAELRHQLMQTHSTQEVRSILMSYSG
jgi:tRNA-dihydrouridine synthase